MEAEATGAEGPALSAESTPASSNNNSNSNSSSSSGQKRKRSAKRRRAAGAHAAAASDSHNSAAASTTNALEAEDTSADGAITTTAETEERERTPPTQWACAACTYLNDAARRACEMCETANPTPAAGGADGASRKWNCVACTMKNSASLRLCRLCGTINPNPVMPSALSMARRSMHGGLFVDELSHEDDDDDGSSDDDDDDDSSDDSDADEEADDGIEGDANSDSSSDDSNSDSGSDEQHECVCLECGSMFAPGQATCPDCHALRPIRRRALKRSRTMQLSGSHSIATLRKKRDKKLKKKKRESDSSVGQDDDSSCEKKRKKKNKSKKDKKKTKRVHTKNAYGVSSEVLSKLAKEPKSTKLVDTLQTLTHTLAMMDASADSEWGGMHGGPSFLLHGFGASRTAEREEKKDLELLPILSNIFRDADQIYPAEVRLFSIQSINYIIKMDRHLFPRSAALRVLAVYLDALREWVSTETDQRLDRSRTMPQRDAYMIVEECVNGLSGLCGSENAMLREMMKRDALNGYLEFLIRLAGDSTNLHTSVVTTAMELFQKCCLKLKWSFPDRADGNDQINVQPSDGQSKSKTDKNESATLCLGFAKRVVFFLRQMLKHKEVQLHVKAIKCLLLVFHRVPRNRHHVIVEMVTADVLHEFVDVVINASAEETEDSRRAATTLLLNLFDNHSSLVSLFLQERIHDVFFDGIAALLHSTSSSLGGHALKLVALLTYAICDKRTPPESNGSRQTLVSSEAVQHRFDSSPDPNVLTNLLLEFIQADSIPAVSALIKDGADLNYPKLFDSEGNEIDKPLQAAAQNASLAMVRFLVKRGADIHQKGVTGTALHVAAIAGRCDVVSFLLECGASPTDRDRDGRTVMERLEAVECEENDRNTIVRNVPSPARKLLELHQRSMRLADGSDGSDGDNEFCSGARRWILSGGDNDFDDDEDEFEDDEHDEDDPYFMDYDEDEDDDDDDDDDEGYDRAGNSNGVQYNGDEELSSDDNEEVAHGDSGNVSTKRSRHVSTKKNRRRESESSDNVAPIKASRKTEDGHEAATRIRERTSSILSEGDEYIIRDPCAATPADVRCFSEKVLGCLLSVLRGVDIQNMDRAVLSTLACVLEMVEAPLIQNIQESDISLLLETVNYLLQDPVSVNPPSDALSVAAKGDHVGSKGSTNSASIQNAHKMALASYILALRILQAIVRKSLRQGPIFYQIERRGICEQIERLHERSSCWVSPSVQHTDQENAADQPYSIFSRGRALLRFLRSNMIESGMLHLHKLKNLSRRVKELTDTTPESERDLVLIDLVELFEQPASITMHEFKQSDLLPSILSYLLPSGITDPVDHRLKVVIEAFSRCPSALSNLVNRLQTSVNQDENLPLVSFFTGKGRELYPLTKQLKIVCSRWRQSNDGKVVSDPTKKVLQLSPLTHFQSFERTIFRCMPVEDPKLGAFYVSLIGHCIHKVVDGKWKKYLVCGYDSSKCSHLVKPTSGEGVNELLEIVLHDSQYKLPGPVDVYENLSVRLEHFGDPVVGDSERDTKKRKRSSKKKKKNSLSGDDVTDSTSSGNNEADLVEVKNTAGLSIGKMKGAWYAAEIVAADDMDVDGTENGTKTASGGIEPGLRYNLKLVNGDIKRGVPSEIMRMRHKSPQKGSVVEVDGMLGEVTCVHEINDASTDELFDIKVGRDRSKLRVTKSRIRYPPASSSKPEMIEAMSISRLFPARESSIVSGCVGDRVWIAPTEDGSGEQLHIAGTIRSYPSGVESISGPATVHVEVCFGEDPKQTTLIKVRQSCVLNLSIGRGKIGSSRLLSVFNTAPGRGSSGPSLHQWLHSAPSTQRDSDMGGRSGSTFDQLRQLISQASARNLSRLDLVASNGHSMDAHAPVSTGDNIHVVASSPATVSATGKKSRGSNSSPSRNVRMWGYLNSKSSTKQWSCSCPPRVNVLVQLIRRENIDDGLFRRGESGIVGSHESPIQIGEAEESLVEQSPDSGGIMLKPGVRKALVEIFFVFDPDVGSQSQSPSPSQSNSKRRKKRKLMSSSQGDDNLQQNSGQSWDINKFCAFTKKAFGNSRFHDPAGTLVDNCVQFSRFASVASRRQILLLDGFLAATADSAREISKSRRLATFLQSHGFARSSLIVSGSVSSEGNERGEDDIEKPSPIQQAAPESKTIRKPIQSFPTDQNMLKCIEDMQRDRDYHTQNSAPPWKFKYFLTCDFGVDWQMATTDGTTSNVTSDPSSGIVSKPSQKLPASSSSHHGMNLSELMIDIGGDYRPSKSMMDAVRLLRYLYDGLPASTKLADDTWRNARLSNKLETQLEDVLSVCSGIYPKWCDAMVASCRFFFPRDLREKLFHATSFGCTRSLHRFRNQLNIEEGGVGAGVDGIASGHDGDGIYNHEITISPIPKERVKVDRANILSSAEAVMKMHGKRKAILDIVFIGEKGYGSGVTAAFYSATAHALQSLAEHRSKHMRLWVPGIENDLPSVSDNDETKDEVVRHPNGLFPFPHHVAHTGLINRFRMMGRLAGKALMDDRLLPLPLSPQFMKLVIGERVSSGELEEMFLSHGKVLASMRRASTQLAGGTPIVDVMIDGVPVDEWLDAVSFSFIDPISQNPLHEGGAEEPVTVMNLTSYVDSVLQLWLQDGIQAQVHAFREGISEVLPIEKLGLLFVPELLALLCGDSDVAWDAESLLKTMKLAHGYTKDSEPIGYFVDVLAEMGVPQRREFLLYATGCPNLPSGGFPALRPPFEVVRRVVDGDNVDRALPFARTCTNTLHLPAYSTKEVLEERLRYALANSRGVIDRD